MQVPSSENEEAGSLEKLPLVGEQHITHILFEEIEAVTVDFEEAFSIEIRDTWMSSIFYYLIEGSLSDDKLKAGKIVRKASKYRILDEWLYRRSEPQPNCII